MGRPKGQTLSVAVIVAAAIACLEREGDSALGVNRIARLLGIQPPSMYKHFDGNAASPPKKLYLDCLLTSQESYDDVSSLVVHS